MGSFNRDNSSRRGYRGGFDRGRRSFGGGRNFGGRNYRRGDRNDRQMFKTVCSNCGNECEVPFKPTGDKPVYCSDCFEKMGGRDEKGSFDRPRQSDRSLESVNAKLDKILSLLQPKEAVETKPSRSKRASKEKVIEETE